MCVIVYGGCARSIPLLHKLFSPLPSSQLAHEQLGTAGGENQFSLQVENKFRAGGEIGLGSAVKIILQ